MTHRTHMSWRAAARTPATRCCAAEVELRTVVYPWHQAAAAARAHDREDWAVALETGLALPTITRGLP